jgi:TPP-dependent pyruvate/acetoin dehydrogenase alpha subunit
MQTPSPNLPADTQREMLRRMLATRCFEESASADCLAGKICGGSATATSVSSLPPLARPASGRR